MKISEEQVGILLTYNSKMDCKLLFKSSSSQRRTKSVCQNVMSFLGSRRSSSSQSEGEADTDIVSETFRVATEGNLVTVKADDRHPCSFIFHFSPGKTDIYMHSEGKKSRGKIKKLLSILEIAEKTNSYVFQNLQDIQAWGGCHSTTAVFGHRKCEISILIHK